MFNSREMIQHAALCAERCSCLTLMGGFVGMAFGGAAIALLFDALRVPCALMVGFDVVAIGAIGDRLWRINRRIRALETFL